MDETGAGIEGMRTDSALARMVAQALRHETFTLLDIGCAGGLAPGWRTFGARLAALGVDGAAGEIERLTAQETNPLVRYRAGLVGLPDDHPLARRIAGKPWWSGWVSGRLAYERHHYLQGKAAVGHSPAPLDDYLRDIGEIAPWTAAGQPDLDYAASFEPLDRAPGATGGDMLCLPVLAAEAGLQDADFLKLDIDGPDYEVLRSAGRLLAQPSLLGAALEVTFVGSHDANDNSFHNVDRLMRQKGFDLFGLSVRTYASAALPSSYMDDHPSQTFRGRPLQGDAIYLRDLASPARRDQAGGVSAEKLAKLAAVMALFNLHDQAAEVLIVHRDKLDGLLDVPSALDVLARELQADDGAPILSYADYIAAFERREPRFFDLYGRRNAWMAGLMAAADEAAALRLAVAALQAEKAALEDRLRAAPPAPPRKGWFSRRV